MRLGGLTNLDACFGNRDGLLLHGFMDCHLVLCIHLVKLINAANAVVCQHQCTSLYAKLTRVSVLHNT